MFKSARWRSEKNKFKAVFKLQFHATKLEQVGGDALMISLVPADVGKPTVRSEKAEIRDGSCCWENPVHETVKLFRDPKSGKIHEKIYYFVVSTASAKASPVGEVSIDFAIYAESTKLSSVSLPLKSKKSDATLQVSIQRLQENSDNREAEELENTNINALDGSLKTQLSSGDADGSMINCNSTEDGPFSKKISPIADLNGNRRASSGSDLTMLSSESSSGLDTPIEFSCPRDVLSVEKSPEASETMIEKLKTEVIALSRVAEVSELELQTLRKQIVKECKRGQDLFKEVVNLKEERDALKEECEQLKAFEKRMDEAKVKSKLKFEGGDPRVLVEELRQELDYEKNLNANLRLQLQKTQESNSELILAVSDLDEMLEQKNREILSLSERSVTRENTEGLQETKSKFETDDDEEQKALEELVKEHSNAKEPHVLEQQVMDLCSELERCKRERHDLEMQMEQLALDYELLKQENDELSYKLEQSQVQEQLKMQYECSSPYAIVNELETQIENLETELKKQTIQFSESLATITQVEIQVKNLEEELEKQAQGFEADLEILMRGKVDQEQRAIRAEEALRKMQRQNVSTAERLQEELRRLSVQMASTLEANEKTATEALVEASGLRLQNSYLEELLQNAKEELQSVRHHYEGKLCELSTKIEQMQSKIEAKSNEVEHGKKQGEETHRILSQEILMLRSEVERLKTESFNLGDEMEQRETLNGELEQMKTSVEEKEMLLRRGNMERNEMESVIALLKKEAEKAIEELSFLRSLKSEKESIIGNLLLELDAVESQCNEFKHYFFVDEFEKEELRREVCQLKSDLRKEEDAFSNLEKQLKDNKSWLTGVAKIELLEGQIKLKETALETATNSFLEKEKELLSKLDVLERSMEELSQNSSRSHEYEFQKIAKDSEDITVSCITQKEVKNTAENLSTTAPVSYENGSMVPIIASNEISPGKEMKASALYTRDEGNLDELLNELALLKERNESMEGELKEMQERYSEISVKFAEVEGERQRLSMTLRSRKNAKKC